ncbi:ribosome-associated translation inhibitor RaiA [Thermoactinomyces intermedius]|uniref:Ribosome hibernation promoting factor n=1 Tax=Thermoactinomyces intermedius TaxID=2024 RepID=A0A8I1A3P7_THEIN|nr:ribosome-associated translation inhibitor RaiA [Thermoactinomyces intermedius]MBA4548193.1 ribosome-associated translation inhibitor RaiA [Thermoactinomyces intermedius]MBA4835243.1 ribosome-associated translation inhibitor RaiA [Thermoactinomyces intermedius]MBH8595037.1 ribosome-associated translation inhibitor RaiA [Thermoactinomyces intermedius]
MKCIVRGHNLQVTDALRDFIERKLSKLERYFDHSAEVEAQVSLNVLKDMHKVEVTIPFPGLLVRAEELSEDMYASVDLVMEKLERQIRKYKTKVNRRSRREAGFRNMLKENASEKGTTMTALTDEEEGDDEIVRVKRFQLKPMDTEEAILQMELLGHNFFVYTNAVTDEINVIYRRKDGKVGLIEPE